MNFSIIKKEKQDEEKSFLQAWVEEGWKLQKGEFILTIVTLLLLLQLSTVMFAYLIYILFANHFHFHPTYIKDFGVRGYCTRF